MITDLLERVAAELGVANETVVIALLAFFVFILFTLLFRKHKYKRMVSEVTKKTSNSSSWGRTPTNIPSISSPPKTLSTRRAMPPQKINTLSPKPSATKMTSAPNLSQPTDIELPKAIIKQLQGVVADAGKLKALFSRIDRLDTIVAELSKLEDLTARIDGLEAIVARLEKLHPPVAAQLSGKHAMQATAPPPLPPPPQQAQPPPILSAETTKHKMLLSEGSDLPEELHDFFATLITKHLWEEKEIRRMALKNELIHNDAIAKINEWAYEKCGDYLVVDDNGQFIVQKDIFARDDNHNVRSIE